MHKQLSLYKEVERLKRIKVFNHRNFTLECRLIHRENVIRLNPNAKEIARAGMEALCASRAARVVIPAQDLLFEGGESRMNVPGISGQGNWHWRITREKLEKLEKLAPLWHQTLKKYDRLEDLV